MFLGIFLGYFRFRGDSKKKKKNMENGKGRFAIYLMLYAIYRRFVSTYFDVESDFNKFKKICVVRKIQ